MEGVEPPKALTRVVKPLLAALLRSPLHGLVSGQLMCCSPSPAAGPASATMRSWSGAKSWVVAPSRYPRGAGGGSTSAAGRR